MQHCSLLGSTSEMKAMFESLEKDTIQILQSVESLSTLWCFCDIKLICKQIITMKKDHIVLDAPLACGRMVAAERFKISPAGA